jgi:hypothetical protein
VTRLRIRDLQAQTDVLAEQLASRRERLTALLPCLVERRWAVKWPAEAAALLQDPEADLDLDLDDETPPGGSAAGVKSAPLREKRSASERGSLLDLRGVGADRPSLKSPIYITISDRIGYIQQSTVAPFRGGFRGRLFQEPSRLH